MDKEDKPKLEMPTRKRFTIIPFILGLASIICLGVMVYLAFKPLPFGDTFGDTGTLAVGQFSNNKLLPVLLFANFVFWISGLIVGLVYIKGKKLPILPLLAFSFNVILFAMWIIVGIASYPGTFEPSFGNRSPAWSPDSTKIAYISNQDYRNIYIMNADGSDKRIIPTKHGAYGLQWLPSGNKIAACYNLGTGNYVTIIIDINNIESQANTSTIGIPWVSPDGAKIAFLGKDGTYVMNTDGSNQIRLTSDLHSYYFAWAPDSNRIAFTRDNGQLNIVNADGSGLTSLGVDSPSTGIEWAPDGNSIAFEIKYGIQLVYVNGSGEKNLSNNNLMLYEDPMWSPDGKKIVFTGIHIFNRGESYIYITDIDSNNVINLSKNDSGASHPVWSPDGTKIAFESYHGGEEEIYVMNADGSKKVKVPGR